MRSIVEGGGQAQRPLASSRHASSGGEVGRLAITLDGQPPRRRNLVYHRLEGGEVQHLFEEGHAPQEGQHCGEESAEQQPEAVGLQRKPCSSRGGGGSDSSSGGQRQKAGAGANHALVVVVVVAAEAAAASGGTGVQGPAQHGGKQPRLASIRTPQPAPPAALAASDGCRPLQPSKC